MAIGSDQWGDLERLFGQTGRFEPGQRLRHHCDRKAVVERDVFGRKRIVSGVPIGVAPAVQELDLEVCGGTVRESIHRLRRVQ